MAADGSTGRKGSISISKLKRLEALQNAILESALDSIIMMDHQGLIVEFNPAAERLFNYKRADVIGREMAEIIIPPSVREAHRKGLKRYLETGIGPVMNRRIELIGMRSDGTEFPVELAITRIPLEGPPLFTGYLRDLTERKQAEMALKEKTREIERLSQVKMDFVTMVTHELKTPLASIVEGINLVFDGVGGPLSEEQMEILALVKKNVNRLGRMVRNVLEFQRLESPFGEVAKSFCDLRKVIDEAAEMLRPEMIRGRHSFVYEPPQENPVNALCDADLMKHVIVNLLANSMRFTPPGGTITLRLNVSSEEVRIEVQDTGIGIDPADLDKVFEMFAQPAGQKAWRTGGFGVGLAFCKKILALHEGRIWAESPGGKGSLFVLTFPRNLRELSG